MKKKLLAGLCAGVLFCFVPDTKAISLGQFPPSVVAGAGVATGLVAGVGGLFGLVFYLRYRFAESESPSETALRVAKELLEGAGLSDNCVFLQVLKKANFDAVAAVPLIVSYCNAVDYDASDYFSYDSFWYHEPHWRARFSTFIAIKCLERLFSALDGCEKSLRSWSDYIEDSADYIDEIVKFKLFVAEVSGMIKESELYKQQIETFELPDKAKREKDRACKLEDREYEIREIEARHYSNRKFINYNGLPANATVQIVQKEAS